MPHTAGHPLALWKAGSYRGVPKKLKLQPVFRPGTNKTTHQSPVYTLNIPAYLNVYFVSLFAKTIMTQQKGFNWKIFCTTVIAFIFYSLICYCAYRVSATEKIPITYIACLCGAILGWIIAIITTPYDKADKGNIDSFVKTIGTFLSGYVLSKFDKVFEKAVKPELLLTDLVGARLMLTICCFGLTWIVVFVFRAYIVND
jgi:hypothetical protein